MFSKNSYDLSVRESSTDRSGASECASTLAVRRYTYDRDTQNHRLRGGQPQRFIKGPIPLDWVAAANGLPGKAGAVGLALWFLVGVRSSKTVKLTKQVEQIACCGRKALYAALSSLEAAGLITVDRLPGRRATVTVLTTIY